MPIPVLALLVLALSLVVPTARAEIQLNGFGQIVAGELHGGDRFPGLTYDDEIGFEAESLLALQLSAPLRTDMDVVAQLVARGREDYDPKLAWAYLRWIAGDHWTVKAGRVRTPNYRHSEHLEVGSAYPFMRPMRTVYNLPYDHTDGVMLTGNYAVGSWELQPALLFGGLDGEVRTDAYTADMKLAHVWGLALDAHHSDWLSLRAGYFAAEATLNPNVPSYQRLLQGLRATGNAAAADAIEIRDDPAYFVNLGGELRYRGGFLAGEFAHYQIRDSFVGPNNGYLLSTGWQLGRWTPVLSWGRRIKGATSGARRLASPPLQPAVQALSDWSQEDASQLSLGLRYHLRANIALKADYTRYNAHGTAPGDSELYTTALVFTF